MMQTDCQSIRWCEGLTQQLVADAGSIGDDRHKLNVSVCQLGKVKEELRRTDTHTSVSGPLLRCMPSFILVTGMPCSKPIMSATDSPQLLQASSLVTLQEQLLRERNTVHKLQQGRDRGTPASFL